MNKGIKTFIFLLILLPFALFIDKCRSKNITNNTTTEPTPKEKETLRKRRAKEQQDSIYTYKSNRGYKVSELESAITSLLTSRWDSGQAYNGVIEINTENQKASFNIITVNIVNNGSDIMAVCSNKCIKRASTADNKTIELFDSCILCGASESAYKVFQEYKRLQEEIMLGN